MNDVVLAAMVMALGNGVLGFGLGYHLATQRWKTRPAIGVNER